MRFASGNCYEGMWAADSKCGLGAMQWRDLDEVYTGEWRDGKPHGEGEFIWGSEGGAKIPKKHMCNVYRGAFSRGQRHGWGAFFYMNGSQYSGQWRADQKQGEGVFVHPDGSIFSGFFAENRIVHLLPAPKEQLQRASEDVQAQYALNVSDVLDRYPATADPAEAAQSRDQRSKELERLLLKYNHCLKQAYKRHSELAVKARLKALAAAAAPPAALPNAAKVLGTITAARCFPRRLFCMSLEQMVRFLRECGLAGDCASTQLSAADVSRVLRTMRAHHETVAVVMLQEYKQQILDLARAEGPLQALDLGESATPPRIALVQEPFCSEQPLRDWDVAADQPLMEREFAEMLVRCVAEVETRRGGGVGHTTLFRALYRVLAEQVRRVPYQFLMLFNCSLRRCSRSLRTWRGGSRSTTSCCTATPCRKCCSRSGWRNCGARSQVSAAP